MRILEPTGRLPLLLACNLLLRFAGSEQCFCQGECMSKSRGRRRTVKSAQDRAVTRSRHAVRLAQGVRVDSGSEQNGVFVLVCAEGRVQLNSGAAAILQLCDGSRDRDGIVTELMRDSHRHALAVEIVEFLDAALARGWIVVA